MRRYAYKAFREGEAPVSSVLTAESKEAAVLRLRENGWRVMRLSEKRPGLFEKHPFKDRKKLALFCREWASLLSAGLPLSQSLTLLSAHGSRRETEILREILSTVEAGSPLTAAFRGAGEFPEFFLSMLSVGETGGTLPEELEGIAGYYEKETEFRRKISSAAAYPLFLFCFSFCVFLVILTVILPAFSLLFESLSLPLPGITSAALRFGIFIKTAGLPILLFLAASGFSFALWTRKEKGKRMRDRLLLRSRFIRRLLLIRFCHALSSLLAGGMPLTNALTQAAEISGNEEARARILRMASELARGGDFPSALEKTGLSFPLLRHMAAAGMESGRLPEFLTQAARLMGEETERKLSRFKAILEPALILAAGFFTAAILFTVMLPIFSAIGKGL